MPIQDLFMGGISAAAGIAAILGAVFDGPWLMERVHARLLANSIGKPLARVLLGLIGVALVALGAAIALGWRVHWE